MNVTSLVTGTTPPGADQTFPPDSEQHHHHHHHTYHYHLHLKSEQEHDQLVLRKPYVAMVDVDTYGKQIIRLFEPVQITRPDGTAAPIEIGSWPFPSNTNLQDNNVERAGVIASRHSSVTQAMSHGRTAFPEPVNTSSSSHSSLRRDGPDVEKNLGDAKTSVEFALEIEELARSLPSLELMDRTDTTPTESQVPFNVWMHSAQNSSNIFAAQDEFFACSLDGDWEERNLDSTPSRLAPDWVLSDDEDYLAMKLGSDSMGSSQRCAFAFNAASRDVRRGYVTSALLAAHAAADPNWQETSNNLQLLTDMLGHQNRSRNAPISDGLSPMSYDNTLEFFNDRSQAQSWHNISSSPVDSSAGSMRSRRYRRLRKSTQSSSNSVMDNTNKGPLVPDPQKPYFSIDLEKIRSGEDNRTTLMIKCVPNRISQSDLLFAINDRFRDKYDFFYLPMDYKSKVKGSNVGYAFINLVNVKWLPEFFEVWEARNWSESCIVCGVPEKPCSVSYARLQGKMQLLSHFLMSSIMHQDRSMRPIFRVSREEMESAFWRNHVAGDNNVKVVIHPIDLPQNRQMGDTNEKSNAPYLRAVSGQPTLDIGSRADQFASPRDQRPCPSHGLQLWSADGESEQPTRGSVNSPTMNVLAPIPNSPPLGLVISSMKRNNMAVGIH